MPAASQAEGAAPQQSAAEPWPPLPAAGLGLVDDDFFWVTRQLCEVADASAGGRIVAEGTPEAVAKVRKSYTGRYLNELEFANTLDPSPYLGLAVHAACAGAPPLSCTDVPTCEN